MSPVQRVIGIYKSHSNLDSHTGAGTTLNRHERTKKMENETAGEDKNSFAKILNARMKKEYRN